MPLNTGIMELRHIRYFVAVAEQLSFTKASQHLRLAQPSLTRQIRNLEEEIGVQLFDRSNSKIALTDEGHRFLFDSKHLLLLSAESIAAVQRMKRRESSQLNIGYDSSMHYELLPSTLAAFRKVCSNVTLNLFHMTSGEQFQALDDHKIDVGFVGLRPPTLTYDWLPEYIVHGQDSIVAAVPATHPLAKKTELKLADLEKQPFIGMSSKSYPGAREWLVNICQQSGFAVKILQEAENKPAAVMFVAHGLGVALMPEQNAEPPQAGVVYFHFSPPLLRETNIAWRADNLAKPVMDYVQIVKNLSRSIVKETRITAKA